MSVLIGLSAYGIHRYVIIYLFLKYRKRPMTPAGHFEELPRVTMQLPIYNEVYVVERLLRSVSEIDYPKDQLQIQVLDDSTDDTRELTASCVEELQSQGIQRGADPPHRPDRFQSRRARDRPRLRPKRIRLHSGRGFRSATPTCSRRPSISLRTRKWG